jgi:hypothetical protein
VPAAADIDPNHELSQRFERLSRSNGLAHIIDIPKMLTIPLWVPRRVHCRRRYQPGTRAVSTSPARTATGTAVSLRLPEEVYGKQALGPAPHVRSRGLPGSSPFSNDRPWPYGKPIQCNRRHSAGLRCYHTGFLCIGPSQRVRERRWSIRSYTCWTPAH